MAARQKNAARQARRHARQKAKLAAAALDDEARREALAADLAARLRAAPGRPEEVAQAYAIVFGGPLGRFVLAHILREAKVGEQRSRDLGGKARAFMDGAAFVALAIAEHAKFDAAAVAVSLLDDSEPLRGRDDERDDGHFGRPDRPIHDDD